MTNKEKICRCVKCDRPFKMPMQFYGTILCEDCDPAMNDGKPPAIEGAVELDEMRKFIKLSIDISNLLESHGIFNSDTIHWDKRLDDLTKYFI